MPITYDSPEQVEAPKTAEQVHNVGVNIRLPRVGEQTVTFYYEAVDASGNVVKRVPITRTTADLSAKYPTDFATVYDIIKSVAYQEAVDSGEFPEGTVV